LACCLGIQVISLWIVWYSRQVYGSAFVFDWLSFRK
jgi:hypothetical protein